MIHLVHDMARVKTFDEESIVERAMHLFWEKGYESTSMIDLTEHLGIGKGSFYSTFKSKENLFVRCIEKYTDLNFPFLDRALENESDFKAGVRVLLENYVDGLLKDETRKGCFMANSCSLIHITNPVVGQKIEEHYSRIGRYFEIYFQKNGVDTMKAKSVSDLIITFLIGASQQSKVNRNKSDYLSTVSAIVDLLD